MRNRFFIQLMIALAFFSCQSISTDNYISWVKDPENGLVKSRKMHDYKIDVQYQTLEYLALSSMPKEEWKKSNLVKALDERKGMVYFTLKLKKNGASDIMKSGITNQEQYNSKLSYFSFGFQQDIKLEINGESVPCELFHFERSYDLAPHRSFVLGFPLDKLKGDLRLVIDSEELGIGICKFQFNQQDIQNAPQPKIFS